MLHTPNYDVRSRAFCGVTAMAAVTGEPISIIRGIVQSFRGPKSDGTKRAIMGMSNKELLATMAVLKWRAIEDVDPDNANNRRDPFTLDDFISVYANDGPFIVNVTGHYIAVSHGEVCDTFTMLPIPVDRWRRQRGRWVKRWWRFEKS